MFIVIIISGKLPKVVRYFVINSSFLGIEPITLKQQKIVELVTAP